MLILNVSPCTCCTWPRCNNSATSIVWRFPICNEDSSSSCVNIAETCTITGRQHDSQVDSKVDKWPILYLGQYISSKGWGDVCVCVCVCGKLCIPHSQVPATKLLLVWQWLSMAMWKRQYRSARICSKYQVSGQWRLLTLGMKDDANHCYVYCWFNCNLPHLTDTWSHEIENSVLLHKNVLQSQACAQ